MHINIPKEAVNAYYPHNDAIHNTFWATALSTLCSFCANLFLNQTLWLQEQGEQQLQVCHWQETATEPGQQSSKAKNKIPETENGLKVFFEISGGAWHIFRNSELKVKKC